MDLEIGSFGIQLQAADGTFYSGIDQCTRVDLFPAVIKLVARYLLLFFSPFSPPFARLIISGLKMIQRQTTKLNSERMCLIAFSVRSCIPRARKKARERRASVKQNEHSVPFVFLPSSWIIRSLIRNFAERVARKSCLPDNLFAK